MKEIDIGALQIIKRLGDAGYSALLAGGCVRDALFGLRPKDWDIATNASPEQVSSIFQRTLSVGEKFGSCIVVLSQGSYDVTTFRSDGPYRNKRHPAYVEAADPMQDALRRDFTINGLFYDPLKSELIDYVDGCKDVEQRKLRCIGIPENRFNEDPLRLLRAIRFASKFDLVWDPATFRAVKDCAQDIVCVSSERIEDELTSILSSAQNSQALKMLMQTDLMEILLPDVAELKGVDQPLEFHPEGDVWIHTLKVMSLLQAPSPELAWAALLHDIGKKSTRKCTDRIRFIGHDKVGAKMAEKICERLRMSNSRKNRIVNLVGKHMQLLNVREMRESTRRRLFRQDYFKELLELHRVDCLGGSGRLDTYNLCVSELDSISQLELRPTRILSGRDLIELGIRPGPDIGGILLKIEDAQLEGEISTRTQALSWVRSNYPGIINE